MTVFDIFLTDRPSDRLTDRLMKGNVEAPSTELKNTVFFTSWLTMLYVTTDSGKNVKIKVAAPLNKFIS